jgi:ElaB/YqjD/DUF883 family membrane-anchored ribosome-binding protein
MSGQGLEYDLDGAELSASELKDGVAALADELQASADDAMRRTLRRIEVAVADIYDVIAEQGSRSVEAIEQQIDERPWTSLLVAFGFGCLVGQLVRRVR